MLNSRALRTRAGFARSLTPASYSPCGHVAVFIVQRNALMAARHLCQYRFFAFNGKGQY